MRVDATFCADPFATRVRELLDYDAITGVFVWRVSRGNARRGDVAGTRDLRGYVPIRVDGRRYWAHRLAWLWVHGVWPTAHIDHIDGDKANNALTNLRDVSRSINAQNLKVSRNNSSGLLGVSRATAYGKWEAQIKLEGRKQFLGRFATKEEAHARYLEAKRELHEGNTL